MDQIKITIITVCFNAVNSIEETLKSIINQSYKNIELIVIDGGSTDGRVDIIKQYADRISYWISEPDKGIYDAMNKGIKIANGEYINFMNTGDTFSDTNVIKGIISSLSSSRPTVIYGDTIEIYDNKEILRQALNPEKLKKQGILCHQSAFIRTDYHKAHPFDLNYKILADFNFFFNAYNFDKKEFHKVDMVIARFSMKDGGLSKSNYDRNYEEYLKIISPNINQLDRIKYSIRRILGKVKRYLLG